MLNIIIYTLFGLGIGFSLGMLAAAVYVEHRIQKRRKQEAARLLANMDDPPFCYMDLNRKEWD